MSLEYYNIDYETDVQNNKKPENLHLDWDDSLYGKYYVDSSNNKVLLKTLDKGTTVSIVETRINANIARGFHDKDNHIIYLIDCDYDGGDSYVWSIDLSDDSIIEIESIPSDVFDIWRYNSKTWICYFGTTGYTLETGIINPQADIIAEWDTVGAGASHAARVNDSDDGTYIETEGGDDSDDEFTFETIDMSGYDSVVEPWQVYQIKIYIRGGGPVSLGAVDITGNKAGMSEINITYFAGLDWVWKSGVWSGLTLTQANLDDLQILFNSHAIFDCAISEIYAIVYFYGNDANAELTIRDIDGDTNHTEDMGAFGGRSWNISQITIVGSDFHFNFKWSNENVELWRFRTIEEDFIELEDAGANTELPPIQQWAIAYDGLNILYFVLQDTGDSKYYLYNYQLTEDILTKGPQYDIALMLDRNTDATANIPFNLEKAFEVIIGSSNGRKIYQIAKNRGALNYISNLAIKRTDGNIVSITDHFLFYERLDNTIELWEFVNRIDEIVNFPDTQHPILYQGGITEAEIELLDSLAIYLDRGVLIQIIGDYASGNITEDTTFLGEENFEGIIMNPNRYKGSGGFKYETPGDITQASDMDWLDSLTLPNNCSATLGTIDNHIKTFSLNHDGGAADPIAHHSFTEQVTGSYDFWWGCNDITKHNQVQFRDITSIGTRLRIEASKYQYRDDADVWQDATATPTNNILDHHRIVWDCVTDTFDWYINGVLDQNDAEFDVPQDEINRFHIICSENHDDNIMYIDAPGLTGEIDSRGYTYIAGWNMNPNDIDDLIDAGYENLLFVLNGSAMSITNSLGGHSDILTLYDNQNNIDIGDFFRISIPFSVSQVYGSIECFIRSDDVSQISEIRLYDVSTIIFRFKMDLNKFQYYDGSWNDIGLAASGDIWYHIRIAFDCDGVKSHENLATDTWKIWINGIEYGDFNFENVVSEANSIRFFSNAADNGYTYYIDAVDFSWADRYYTNRNLTKILQNQVILEGFVFTLDLRTVPFRSLVLRSYAHYELLQIKPHITDYTNYTGKKTGPLITQLLNDFTDYITPGTLSDGSRTWTCPDDWTAEGDKEILTIINELSEEEGFAARLRPQGELDFDDATTKTGFAISTYTNYDNVDAFPLSGVVNFVKVWGGINSATGKKFGPIIAENLASQQLLGGINKWEKTYANVFDLDALQDIANNKLILISAAPLIVEIEIYSSSPIYGQPGELLYIAPGIEITNSDQTIPEGDYVIINSRVDPKNFMIDYKLSDGLYRENHPSDEDLSQQNAQLIIQNATNLKTLAPTIYSDTVDPTVNDDVDLGFKRGDMWINTTDDGTFICRNNSDGAADWKEL